MENRDPEHPTATHWTSRGLLPLASGIAMRATGQPSLGLTRHNGVSSLTTSCERCSMGRVSIFPCTLWFGLQTTSPMETATPKSTATAKSSSTQSPLGEEGPDNRSKPASAGPKRARFASLRGATLGRCSGARAGWAQRLGTPIQKLEGARSLSQWAPTRS